MESEHIVKTFDSDLKELRCTILKMGGTVESMIFDATQALLKRDDGLAKRVIATDREVNRYETEIDEMCLELLARRQPAAGDLRLITLALKIVTDLERIGDKCANIAKRVLKLNQEPPLSPYVDFPRMANWTQVMIKEALDALVRADTELAYKVCRDDGYVNDLNEQIQRVLLSHMFEDRDTINRCMLLYYISKSIERIADHATNIAEMVIFIVKGKDVRHLA